MQEDNTTNGGTLGGQPALTGIKENWSHELFDLKDFLGGANVRFRLRFTSDNDASAFAFEKDDGFYIDNLKLVKTTSIATLAVKFGNFNAQLLMNNTVRLDWEAYTDQQHDYFEVQRATDKNSNFITIAKIKSQPPYIAYDESPELGNNYYRIKEVDKSGLVTYTNIIKINLRNKIITSVYPNPATTNIHIINEGNKYIDQVLITDINGQLVKSFSSHMNLDISDLKSGLYFVRVRSHDTYMNFKFMKNE